MSWVWTHRRLVDLDKNDPDVWRKVISFSVHHDITSGITIKALNRLLRSAFGLPLAWFKTRTRIHMTTAGSETVFIGTQTHQQPRGPAQIENPPQHLRRQLLWRRKNHQRLMMSRAGSTSRVIITMHNPQQQGLHRLRRRKNRRLVIMMVMRHLVITSR